MTTKGATTLKLGRHGTKYGASYSASKWGIIGFAARMVSGATYDVTAGDSAHNTA